MIDGTKILVCFNYRVTIDSTFRHNFVIISCVKNKDKNTI